MLFVVVVVVVEFGLFFCTYIDFKTISFLFLFPFSAGNGNTGNHVTAAARTGGRYSPFHYYHLLSSVVLLSELHQRAKRARGKSPIAKEMW